MTHQTLNSAAHARSRFEKISYWFSNVLIRLQATEEVILIGTSLIVGIGTGVGAIIFNELIKLVGRITFEWLPQTFGSLGGLFIIFIPALGGLLAGPLIYRFAREAKGHGVPEVMEAIALRGGRIRPVVVVIKAIASSLTIGTGGSAGREGPIVQIGSALGSTVGQFLHLSDERIRNLVASGAAGGIAATFNAPIAGVIFAVEIILGEISVGNVGMIVITAVTASTVMQAAVGAEAVFSISDPYTIETVWEYGFYAILGLLAGLTAAAFIRTLYWTEDVFEHQNFIPEWLQPAVGGLLLGVLGFISIQLLSGGNGMPQIFGGGYGPIIDALTNHELIGAALLLIVFKMIATNLTLGSGGSGGVFAPGLFMGAMLGAAVGITVNNFFPTITAPPGAYALVGMAAVFAGAAHAPITAVIMLFELTGDYHIILPLMLTVVISIFVARRLVNNESIYTLKLTRRGIRLQRGRDIDLMQGVKVSEVMQTPAPTISEHLTLLELRDTLRHHHTRALSVVDDRGDLSGVITLSDLQRVFDVETREADVDIEKLTIGDICKRNVITTTPDAVVWEAIRTMGTRGIGWLPVVKPGTRELVGMLRRHDIMTAYNVAITRKLRDQQRAEQIRLNTLTGAHVVEFRVVPGCSLVNQYIRDVKWPEESLIASIKRRNKLIVPHGNTQLQANDVITVVTEPEVESAIQAMCKPEADMS